MSGRNPAQQQRSSADLYASIPLSDGAYPPIRSITPQTPQVVSPTYAQHPPQQTPPSYLAEHGRTPSTASDFSARDPFRASMPNSRPGTATGGGAYDPPASNDYPLHGGGGDASGRYSPSDRGSVNGGIGSGSTDWGSSANLNQIMYRNGPPGAQAGRSDSYLGDKEVLAGGGTSPRDAGTLRKKNYAAAAGTGDYDPLGGPRRTGPGGWWSRKSTLAKWLLALGALLVVIAAIAIPVGIVKSRDSSDSSNKVNAAAPEATSSSSVNDGTEEGIPTAATPVANWQTAPYGGNGSVIFLQDGSNFTYLNNFGGYWVSIPFNDTARPQRDVPALNEDWDYVNNRIAGVNIGGWLVLEPFIVPGMFERFNSPTDYANPNATTNPAIDEWTLSEQLGSNLTNAMTEHYETFITEKDFAEIAAAGLNWVRIPFGWWAIETWDGEPFLQGVAWTYLLKAIEWARKYGLRVNLDFHAIPGSQNGYNHSGKQGSINFLAGVMGVANAQRTLDYIRTITEFISQDQYKNVVPMFSIMNEPYAASIGMDPLRSFYLETYNMMREITGIGEGKGPFIAFHDGFSSLAAPVAAGGWNGFLNGWDRVAIDSHRYLCFADPNNWGLGYQATLPCSYWAGPLNSSTNAFGVTLGAEWSLAINDCGKWLNNVGNGNRYDGTYYIPGQPAIKPEFDAVGSCEPWNDWKSWNQTTKNGLRMVAEAHMDALKHFFFWTWKTGYSSTMGQIANPMWNYQLGLAEGWVPSNPRTAVGVCPSLAAAQGITYESTAAPSLSAWMTGGSGAGRIVNQTMSAQYSQWPPASIGAGASTGPLLTPVSNLPTYTQTASVYTMPPPPQPTSFPDGYASSSVDVGNGWAQPSDSASFYTPVAGCSYPNAWSGAGVAIPTTAFCAGNGARMKRNIKSTATIVFQPTPAPTPAAV
ncbi:hypothetical protein C6P46_005274 [Rhodotorula mucilaginosa]|uniref:glucan 1,3-beta-glucosidase n=1 Tax=Rhodotorula mucilaginosa TaxID=5537 RepID=A0A9P7B4Q6_RHOMI|nr:hypothetical protein C6P46_005274 [Rhodotorula mucilaginosa]